MTNDSGFDMVIGLTNAVFDVASVKADNTNGVSISTDTMKYRAETIKRKLTLKQTSKCKIKTKPEKKRRVIVIKDYSKNTSLFIKSRLNLLKLTFS